MTPVNSDGPFGRPNPCAGNRADQLVLVSLARQHMWLCADDRVQRDYPMTSGRDRADERTPTGTFHIQGRNKNSVLTLADGQHYEVKYWIPFDAPDFGFHDSPWQTVPYGTQQYRTDGSHGCVHMPLHAIEYFYSWIQIGTKVRITST